jgi:hypothetical protein
MDMVSARYDGCDSGFSKYCVEPMRDVDGVDMSGLVVGCYPLEALLQSTLEYLYEESCFQRIFKTSSMPIDASLLVLNASLRNGRAISPMKNTTTVV